MAEDEDVKTDEIKDKPKKNGVALTMALRKPIKDQGEEINELNFREPTAGDIERAGGNPITLDVFSGDTPKISFDAKTMTAMMGLLAAVPPSTIRQLHPKDWNSIAWQLVHFFTPDL
jgi:hypothetical protein